MVSWVPWTAKAFHPPDGSDARVAAPRGAAAAAATICSAPTVADQAASRRSRAPAPADVRHPIAGIFGYSHLTGGFAGGQSEYARVPFADVGPLKVENDLADEQVLFLSDILPTGYMGAEMCGIDPGDVVAVWGAGPVGQFAMIFGLLA